MGQRPGGGSSLILTGCSDDSSTFTEINTQRREESEERRGWEEMKGRWVGLREAGTKSEEMKQSDEEREVEWKDGAGSGWQLKHCR